MFISGEISFTYLAIAHSILSILSDINRCFEIIFEFKFFGFNRYNLYYRHIYDEFLRILFLEQSPLEIPTSSFEEEALDITTIFWFLSNFLLVYKLSDLSVESALV